jgi:hypothetical protein
MVLENKTSKVDTAASQMDKSVPAACRCQLIYIISIVNQLDAPVSQIYLFLN